MSSTAHPARPLRISRAPALRFRVLGPLDVLVDGKPCVLDRPMHRTLLALLLVRAGEFVSVDRLTDELWVGDPPKTARASLQNTVCQLRKILGADSLLTGARGYCLNVELEQIDLGRFRRIVADASAATTRRRLARKLRDALALWRGPALADIEHTPSLEFEASLLNEQRILTLETAIDAELELGGGAELVPELERLVASEPYRERLRAQLILALYRSGRQRRALEAFKDARHTLLSELGLEPSPQLRALERAILNHDPALATPRAPRTSDRAPRFNPCDWAPAVGQ